MREREREKERDREREREKEKERERDPADNAHGGKGDPRRESKRIG